MEAQTRQIEQLRAKLIAAETLCEELMDENEDMKKELRDLEEEIEEMQDNFRYKQSEKERHKTKVSACKCVPNVSERIKQMNTPR